MRSTLTIATRQSPLAQQQTQQVIAALKQQQPDLDIQVLPLLSSGDKQLNTPLRLIGGKALFVKELQYALLEKRADIAVHSVKDMPPLQPNGLELAAVLPRADARDCFVHPQQLTPPQCPEGSVIGSCSPRRQALLQHAFSHLQLTSIRGNVATRLEKMHQGQFDGLVMACAGLHRLGFKQHLHHPLDPEQFTPAAGQGTIGIECRQDDAETIALLSHINHATTWQCTRIERAIVAQFSAHCHSAIGVYCVRQEAHWYCRATVLDPSGTTRLDAACRDDHPDTVIETIHQDLISQGAQALIDQLPRS